MNILVDIIPPKYRKYVLYGPFALAGLILGVLQLMGDDVTVALAVYAFIGSALGLTAYSNTYVWDDFPDDIEDVPAVPVA